MVSNFVNFVHVLLIFACIPSFGAYIVDLRRNCMRKNATNFGFFLKSSKPIALKRVLKVENLLELV